MAVFNIPKNLTHGQMYSILTTKILLHNTCNRCRSSLFTVEDSTPRRGQKKKVMYLTFSSKNQQVKHHMRQQVVGGKVIL